MNCVGIRALLVREQHIHERTRPMKIKEQEAVKSPVSSLIWRRRYTVQPQTNGAQR